MNRWTYTQAEGGQAGRKTDRPRNRWTDTQTENAWRNLGDRWISGNMSRWTDRQAKKQKIGQAERQIVWKTSELFEQKS
jgi:hypothetical protein